MDKLTALIIPTHKCNLRCKHCLRSHYDEGDLDLDVLEEFFIKFREKKLGSNFSITGGEPTIHHNFASILELCKKYGLKGTIVSNGQSEAGIKEIINFREIINWAVISLEGPNSLINDRIRGKGAFKKALNSIQTLKENKIKVRVKVTLNALNINFIRPMFLLADVYNVDHLLFSLMMPCVKTKKNQLDLSIEEIHGAHNIYNELKRKYANTKSGFRRNQFEIALNSKWPLDLCSFTEIVLMPNGDVSLCCDLANYDFSNELFEGENDKKLDHILGNIKTDSFDKILEKRRELIETLNQRRADDSRDGLLVGPRQLVCENCKFYFFKN
jgi:MoaA/NifB/PqqE/SkfB family radical SAM enzyme